MFKRILVAYGGSPESGRALIAGIQLAKKLSAELRAACVCEKLPDNAVGYVGAGAPGETVTLPERAPDYFRDLQIHAQETARQQGIALNTEVVEGDEVQAIVECVQRSGNDLWVLGIPRHAPLEPHDP